MVNLYRSMHRPDKRRFELVRDLADKPASIAGQFAQTRDAIARYHNTEPFHPRRLSNPVLNPGLFATNDVACRLGPVGTRRSVITTGVAGLNEGALDFAYVDRDLLTTRTTKPNQRPGVAPPTPTLRAGLLLAAPDGVPIVGKIKIKDDRDLAYALIQALACVSLLATPSQYERLRRHYPDRLTPASQEGPPRYDIYLMSVPRTDRATYLADLDGLAPVLAAAILLYPEIAQVVRRIAGVRTHLEDGHLYLEAMWLKQPPGSELPQDGPTDFDIDSVKALRRSARASARPSLDGPNGWATADSDPADVVACFPPLRVREGHELHAYQYRADGNGNGIVWAVPARTPQLAPSELGAKEDLRKPPRPPEAIDDLMAAIDGDRSAWSYLCASILARELHELGALWHGCSWSDETILASAPWATPASADGAADIPESAQADWQITGDLPSDWRPLVTRDGTTVIVRFYTYSEIGSATVYEKEDRYTEGGYTHESRETNIASGPSGFVY